MDIQKCFDPVISSMIGLVEQQQAEVTKEGAPAIKVNLPYDGLVFSLIN